MTGRALLGAVCALLATAMPVQAIPSLDTEQVSGGGDSLLPPFLQCVPYARQLSGIRIFGDAHTWWDQAEGRYARGRTPKVGAVMNFRPFGNSRLGHVAAVSRIIDSRTVLISHANWSPINGRRGQIENNVRAVDVSEDNDWSEVRVWFAPSGNLGATHWPLYGFIYNKPAAKPGSSLMGERERDRSAAAAPTQPRLAKQPRADNRAAAASDDPIGDIIRASRQNQPQR